MLKGVLIAESLRAGGALEDVPLRVIRIRRSEAGIAAAGQPPQWTRLFFEAPDPEAGRLAEGLARYLSSDGGRHANSNTPAEAFVVFAEQVFRYPRGGPAGRGRAQEYSRSVGVPEPQPDWED
jgi:hypothetical protein